LEAVSGSVKWGWAQPQWQQGWQGCHRVAEAIKTLYGGWPASCGAVQPGVPCSSHRPILEAVHQHTLGPSSTVRPPEEAAFFPSPRPRANACPRSRVRRVVPSFSEPTTVPREVGLAHHHEMRVRHGGRHKWRRLWNSSRHGSGQGEWSWGGEGTKIWCGEWQRSFVALRAWSGRSSLGEWAVATASQKILAARKRQSHGCT